jgi:putative membrane protein
MGHRIPDSIHGVLATSVQGMENFLIYFAAALALTVLYLAIYVRITPYREIHLIREGNVAAAASLSGALLGFVIPLASAISQSVAFVDMLLWGVIALVVQLLAFVGARKVMPKLVEDIPNGNTAQGVLLGALHLAVGVLNAASMTY